MTRQAQPALTLVQSEPIDLHALWREEIRTRDWTRVHIDADRRAPISLARRVWRYTMPIARRSRGEK